MNLVVGGASDMAFVVLLLMIMLLMSVACVSPSSQPPPPPPTSTPLSGGGWQLWGGLELPGEVCGKKRCVKMCVVCIWVGWSGEVCGEKGRCRGISGYGRCQEQRSCVEKSVVD